MLASNKLDSDRLKVLYPKELGKPDAIELQNITISALQTDHFIDWHPVHISFLINIDGKQIYAAGDSSVSNNHNGIPSDIDILILCNHLISCHWSVDTYKIEKCTYKFKNVTLLHSNSDYIEI